MLSRPKLRFSILTIMLVTALVAVSVSHWLVTQRLRTAQVQLREQKRIVRHLNDDLHRLTVDDPSQVHVIANRESWTHWAFKPGFVAVRNMGWQVYLPSKPFAEQPEWRLCCAVDNIPAKGLPSDSASGLEIDTGLDSQIPIAVEFSHGKTTGWFARITHGENETLHFIGDKSAAWLKKDDEPMELACAGQRPEGDARAIATESFAPQGPVVLLRQRRTIKTATSWAVDPSPTQGIMLWLERIGAKGR